MGAWVKLTEPSNHKCLVSNMESLSARYSVTFWHCILCPLARVKVWKKWKWDTALITGSLKRMRGAIWNPFCSPSVTTVQSKCLLQTAGLMFGHAALVLKDIKPLALATHFTVQSWVTLLLMRADWKELPPAFWMWIKVNTSSSGFHFLNGSTSSSEIAFLKMVKPSMSFNERFRFPSLDIKSFLSKGTVWFGLSDIAPKWCACLDCIFSFFLFSSCSDLSSWLTLSRTIPLILSSMSSSLFSR